MDVKKLFTEAAQAGASDIHLVASHAPMLRHDGELQAFSSSEFQSELSVKEMENIVSELLSPEQFERLKEDMDLDAAIDIDIWRFRLNFSFADDALKLVARIISDHKPSLEEIGMPTAVAQLLDRMQGLILVTGPTGCGKSTTLAAMIEYINQRRSCHIVTLEDPVEFLFKGDKSLISQRQLGSDMKSFASGLKHILRQDPNVIMIGEMRDLETIAAAITLAETGHLVLATLHTYNAAQTVDRIIDIFPANQQGQIRSQLSNILAAVISQRLLPRRGGGRVAAREIMIRNSAVSNLIREGKIAQIKSVIETGSQDGMSTMEHHLKELYQAGEIDEQIATEYLNEAAH